MTRAPACTSGPSPSRPGPAAVLWDMDGTLVDTEPFWVRAETELVTALGGTWTDDDARAVVGFDLLDAAAHLRRAAGIAAEPVTIVEQIMDRVAEQVAASPPWQPGALRLLAALADAGIPSVLVTMSWRRLVREIVDLLPAGTFAATVAGDEVARGKPHPEPYLAAAGLVAVDPATCVAIEDSPTGARSARAAGCKVLGVPHMVDIPAHLLHARAASLAEVDVGTLRAIAAR